MNRRQFITSTTACASISALALEEKTGDGGFAPVSWAARESKDCPVLPPGAHSQAHFTAHCVGCGLCAAACPSKCLRPSTDPRRLGRVELDFRHGYCKIGCTKCGEVCPAGAIDKVGFSSKPLYHVGHAVWYKASCVRTTDGVECHACEKHCPVKAIRIIAGFPVVDAALCIGCGACEHYCPARPKTAIRVEGYERHREFVPMDESDLLGEMIRLIGENHAAVIARNGVIVRVLDGRGLKPIEEAISADANIFASAIVADKVVGLRAAEIYVRGKAQKVWGRVMSEGAKSLLEKNGITAQAEKTVAQLDCEKGNCK